MAFDQRWLEITSQQIVKARKLSEVDSKRDPENAPYDSKYEARKVIKDLLSDAEERVTTTEVNEEDLDVQIYNIDQQRADSELHESVRPAVLLAALEYEMAVNYVETEEVATGEEHLKNCLSYLMNCQSGHSSVVSLFIAIKCQLGIIWSNRSDHQKAFEFFQEAESDYEYYQKNTGRSPLHYKDILLLYKDWIAATSKAREEEFEKQHTLTLYYIAQSYGNLGDHEKSAKYCHITLLRQMETSQYDPSDWALNCATLGQYYLTKDMYTFSRYCLACASQIGIEAESKFNPENFEEDEVERASEKIKKMKADIARCWAKYCLNLLISSHNKKCQEMLDSELQQPQTEESGEDDLKHLKFSNLEVTSFEEDVTDQYAKDFEEARKIFLCGQKWLQEAKEFYVFDGYVSDFVEICQDHSQLFKYVAFFDDSFERRCKMHKRRIDILNTSLIELNPQHFLQICRQLSFEIGEIYTDMADLKKAIMEQDASRVTAESIKKYNKMLLQGIKYYQGFIDSYNRNNEPPESYEDDAVRGVLLSYFYIARLNSKYLTPEKDKKIEHMKKEMKSYEFIATYCESHPNMPKVFEEELEMSKEMLALFPAKMNKILDM